MILVNGKIATLDVNNPRAEAIAFQDDRILLVGSTNEVESLKNDQTNQINFATNFDINKINNTNLTNNQSIWVKVIGRLPNGDSKVIIKLSPKAFEKLNAVDKRVRAEISYLLQ